MSSEADNSTSHDTQGAAAQARFLEGWAFHQKGEFARAEEKYRQTLDLQPRHFDALHLLGILAVQKAAFAEAVAWIGKAIAVAPENPAARFNLGVALEKQGRLQAAADSFGAAIALKADYADAHYQRGNALRMLGQHGAAIAAYDKALQIRPSHAEVFIDRGISLWLLGQAEAAVESYNHALRISPVSVEALINRGVALRGLHRLPEAVASFNQAIAVKPDHHGAYINRGATLTDLGDHAGALADFDKAIQFQPDNANAHNNRGVALSDLGRNEAALASFDKVIALNPAHADAHFNRGNALRDLKQYEAAIAAYDQSLKLNPNTAFLRGIRLHTKMHICDWQNFTAEVADLTVRTERGEAVTPPFNIFAASDSPQLQRRAAEIWTAVKSPRNDALGAIPARPKHDKIRIGYFSPDFRDHPVAALLAGVIDAHDRRNFEVIGFSFGPDTRDPMRIRLQGAFDKFIDVRSAPDREVAEMARCMELDIAVDLAGYTADARMRAFAMRVAPVQVNFLGYPGTMGLETIDYMIADETLISAESRKFYSEKIVTLPSFQPNDAKRKIADITPHRRDLGLPDKSFVFCCFNNAYKITPDIFDLWMRILKRVSGSVLWLSDNNPRATRNLRAEADRRGVSSDRLIFAKRVASADEHLARQRAADLFLDTRPYNAHTTASDALWAGLPVLTCPTATFAGRVAASLLTALDLRELIAPTPEAYETLAVALAGDAQRLTAIREKLARNRFSSPLFDTATYTRHLEAAYTQVHARALAGLAPDDVRIEP